MMYANIRGANGQILGSVAIDPTQPGGLQGALADAVQKLQQPGAGPLPRPGLPPIPAIMQPGSAMGPAQPVSQSSPFLCELRFKTRLANGAEQWVTRTINCPVGLPPGVYIHVPHGGR